jgi:hypothetical protein
MIATLLTTGVVVNRMVIGSHSLATKVKGVMHPLHIAATCQCSTRTSQLGKSLGFSSCSESVWNLCFVMEAPIFQGCYGKAGGRMDVQHR